MGNATLTRLRGQLMGESEDLVSFDRLAPSKHLEDVITVAGQNGKWRARAVAPTFGLVPISVDRLLVLDGLENAVQVTEGITPDRAAFLERRIGYWRAWAGRKSGALIYDPWQRE